MKFLAYFFLVCTFVGIGLIMLSLFAWNGFAIVPIGFFFACSAFACNSTASKVWPQATP